MAIVQAMAIVTSKEVTMKNLLKKIKKALHNNPTIVYGWASVGATYLVKKYPDIPNELIILTLLSFLGLSHKVQRIEDKKTEQALYTNPTKENNGKTPR